MTTYNTIQQLTAIQTVLQEALSLTSKENLVSNYVESYIKTSKEDAYSSLRFIITDEEKEECVILIEFLTPTDEVQRVNKLLHSNGLTGLSFDCITLEARGKLPPVDFTTDDIINCYKDEDKTEINISVSVTDNVLNSYYVNLTESVMVDTDCLIKITDKVAFENEEEMQIS